MTVTLLDPRESKRREDRLRRRVARNGYALRKSRLHGGPRPDDYGEYMIVDPFLNVPVAGWNYDYSFDDVEAWMQDDTA
jgi:hypothetical protein